ncbi:hypothetical protein KP509_25G067600 [Ceratopteris richardii]|uniref:C3H1-type domain-containing protein n=1 Tax=Ceratopteris richardii TaxID=49495 RepID=A0A8T2RTT5_CERRI|nr:hypothetical protein KP509_25G067600 [Ceratopteris richardii]
MDSASTYQQSPKDCVHFFRTGNCRYGPNCRFNHRVRVQDPTQGTSYPAQLPVEYPERIGQPDCQFYLKTGTCKFGTQCKYHHPHGQAGSARGPPLLNFVGLPLRPGEKECAFYLRTGSCKFGVACKFHHPNPAGIGVPCFPSYPNNPSLSPAPMPTWRPLYFPGPGLPGSPHYIPVYPSSPHAAGFNANWTSYQNMGSPMSNGGQQQVTVVPPPFDGPLNSSPKMEHQDCQYFVQTGHCKFGANCKYQHPKSIAVPVVPAHLSPMGLPLRPGQPLCTFYLKNGICKFGSICRYDHPIRDFPVSSLSFPSNNAAKVEEKSSESDAAKGVESDSFPKNKSDGNELPSLADTEQYVQEDGVSEITEPRLLLNKSDGPQLQSAEKTAETVE